FSFVGSAKAISLYIDTVLGDQIIDAFFMKSSITFVNVGKKVAMIQDANVRFSAVFVLIGMACVVVYFYVPLGL
ncbi:NADH-quinone oxidoreductase subunit L, partial [Aliarcobacter butzleri]